jgi:predicted RNA-binding Zn-ribbon protein involved in translation (DUF1610 family)
MDSLKIECVRKGEWDVLHLSGKMDENSGLQLLRLYRDASSKCRFNFRDVVSINSHGLRAWVLFLRDFQTDRVIELEECSPVVVDQMNMLPSFLQKARVRSIFVPFDCISCGQVTTVLVDEAEFQLGKRGGKVGRCKQCHAQTQANKDVDYFAFVKDEAS